MTREDVLSLPSTDLTDRMVHKLVMGATGKASRYTLNISRAWMVVDRLRAGGLTVQVRANGKYVTCSVYNKMDYELLSAGALAAPLAICRAALLIALSGGLHETKLSSNETGEDSQ